MAWCLFRHFRGHDLRLYQLLSYANVLNVLFVSPNLHAKSDIMASEAKAQREEASFAAPSPVLYTSLSYQLDVACAARASLELSGRRTGWCRRKGNRCRAAGPPSTDSMLSTERREHRHRTQEAQLCLLALLLTAQESSSRSSGNARTAARFRRSPAELGEARRACAGYGQPSVLLGGSHDTEVSPRPCQQRLAVHAVKRTINGNESDDGLCLDRRCHVGWCHVANPLGKRPVSPWPEHFQDESCSTSTRRLTNIRDEIRRLEKVVHGVKNCRKSVTGWRLQDDWGRGMPRHARRRCMILLWQVLDDIFHVWLEALAMAG
eukprot:scaffold735_cov255-Pinguiococcus_pyrenoidosus.AAC.18